jgi:hypothetical protein
MTNLAIVSTDSRGRGKVKHICPLCHHSYEVSNHNGRPKIYCPDCTTIRRLEWRKNYQNKLRLIKTKRGTGGCGVGAV